MKLSNLEFIAKPFFIGENETKSLDLGDLGTFKISLVKENSRYSVAMHNTTKLKFLDPIEDNNSWVKYFDTLGQAKAFAEVTYLNFISKLINRFSSILDSIVNVELISEGGN